MEGNQVEEEREGGDCAHLLGGGYLLEFGLVKEVGVSDGWKFRIMARQMHLSGVLFLDFPHLRRERRFISPGFF